MVYPARDNIFEISTGEDTYVPIKDVETYSVAIDGNVEEWHAYDAEGWARRLMTAKSLTVSLSGKRNVGDPGNDYVAGCMTELGAGCDSTLKWTMPSKAVMLIPCVVNVTTPGGGDASGVDSLEAEFMSNGKPDYTPGT